MHRVSNAMLPRLAFVGRSEDRELLRGLVARARAGSGGVVFLASEGGVGKTRLADLVRDEAARDGFATALGRSYPVESGAPYALFSDALVPLIRSLDRSTLTTLARGGLADLGHIIPGLTDEAGQATSIMQDPAEFRTRLLWTFAEFLSRLSQRSPLLIVLDDVQWADASSLELLHFLGRQTAQQRILYLATYNETELHVNPGVSNIEKSLISLGVARLHHLNPLTHEDTQDLIEQTFGANRAVVSGFATRLFEWTGGNPFFIQETLESLIATNRLHERDGTWLGWEIRKLDVPSTVRDAVTARLARLSQPAQHVAELAAVLGTRFALGVMRAVWQSDDADLAIALGGLRGVHAGAGPRDEAAMVIALEELRAERVLVEHAGDRVSYDFSHPMFRQVIYSELGIARARLLHGRVAASLEQHYHASASDHADELAYHFARADLHADAPKAVRYLAAAGQRALARFANHEAADYLALALELASPNTGEVADASLESDVIENLARARQRLGEFDTAVTLFERARGLAERAGDVMRAAENDRRMGLCCYWASRHDHALSHFDRGLSAVRDRADLQLRLLLARGACLMELGRASDARTDIEAALELAERRQDVHARARALRALLMLHTWCGPPALARQHGHATIALAREIGAQDVLFQAHWTLGALEGLSGHTAAMAEHIAAAEQVARSLRSPMLEVWTSELVVEYAFAIGDWDMGLARGEQGIALARSFNQRQLLPRLLVWTSLIYMGRGDLERSRTMIDEAWAVSGAADVGRRPVDVHTVVPAHIGRAAWHLTQRDFDEAVRVAKAGLEIADRTGYEFWAIHRLMPIIAEAYCNTNELEGAAQIAKRLEEESERLGHRLGLAWAQALRALIVWRGGDSASGARLMAEAVEVLEAVPIMPDAARLRRQMAGRLAEIGDRAGALRELRHVHAVFAKLGAERELEKARGQFRELGARPPAREEVAGAEGLTGRELAIARLVAQRKSNKSIGKALDISPRTVSTHLSSIFRKVGVGSRAELADYVRTNGLLGA